MTIEQRRRVFVALVETKALLAREMRYVKHLRAPAVIERYEQHIAKLERYLEIDEVPTMGAAQ